MSAVPKEFGDVEAGESPQEMETPEDLQQAFICKVYLIISIQVVLTIVGVAAVVILIKPLAYFLMGSGVGLPFYVAIGLAAITALCLLYCHHQASYLLLWVLTTALITLVGLTCAVASGKAVFGSAVLTGALVINLTHYTFWAASKGYDFEFLGPILCGAISVVTVLASLQIIYPMGEIFFMVYGCFGCIAFSSYIVCFTDSLVIKTYSYDKYIWAAVSLYVDFINLFLLLLSIFKAIDY